MSNPLIDGGWAEYQRLVLSELERLNRLLAASEERHSKFGVDLELLKREVGKLDEMDHRLRTLENDALTSGAIGKYRKWLIGGALLLITSVIIPLINLYLSK